MLNADYAFFTQTQAAECTSADARTIENYVNYDYVRPIIFDGRRRFTLRQLLKIEFTFRLASVCKIPPSSRIGERILTQDRFGLADDLRQPSDSPAWAYRQHDRLDLIFDAKSPKEVKLAPDAAARSDSIHLGFPARHFSRLVIQKAAPLMTVEQ